MKDIKGFFSKEYNYAIIGASNNRDKFGYKIVEKLKEKEFNVFPVNKKEKEILGLKVYETLSDINQKIDVVNFVVPSGITIIILEEVKKLGIKKVWFQPKSYDKKCLKYCKDNRIKVLYNKCLLEETTNYNVDSDFNNK